MSRSSEEAFGSSASGDSGAQPAADPDDAWEEPGATPPRLSMNEVTTYRWSLDEDLHHYERAGYAGVGVWLRKLEDFGEERGVELLSDSPLAVSNVVWAGGFTGSDGVSTRESLDRARHAIRVAGAVRAGSLVLCSGGRNHHTRRHADRLFRAALDTLLPQAERARVPLAIEPVNAACAASWSILTRLESVLELLEDYDSPWLQVVLDTYHFPMRDGRWDLLREVAPRLAVVHLADLATPHTADEERCPLGEGVAPLARIVRTLREAGYAGFFDVELAGPAIEPLDYRGLLASTRRRFETSIAARSPHAGACTLGG